MEPQLTDNTQRICCSHSERDMLRDGLRKWRDSLWAGASPEDPMLRWHWTISDENIDVLVNSVDELMNTPTITSDIVADIEQRIAGGGPETAQSLVSLLSEFRAMVITKHAECNRTVKRGRSDDEVEVEDYVPISQNSRNIKRGKIGSPAPSSQASVSSSAALNQTAQFIDTRSTPQAQKLRQRNGMFAM